MLALSALVLFIGLILVPNNTLNYDELLYLFECRALGDWLGCSILLTRSAAGVRQNRRRVFCVVGAAFGVLVAVYGEIFGGVVPQWQQPLRESGCVGFWVQRRVGD